MVSHQFSLVNYFYNCSLVGLFYQLIYQDWFLNCLHIYMPFMIQGIWLYQGIYVWIILFFPYRPTPNEKILKTFFLLLLLDFNLNRFFLSWNVRINEMCYWSHFKQWDYVNQIIVSVDRYSSCCILRLQLF